MTQLPEVSVNVSEREKRARVLGMIKKRKGKEVRKSVSACVMCSFTPFSRLKIKLLLRFRGDGQRLLEKEMFERLLSSDIFRVIESLQNPH